MTLRPISIRGTVPQIDQDRMTFEIRQADGRRVRAPLALDQLKVVLQAVRGYGSGVGILLQGMGSYGPNQRLQRIESVERVAILGPLDIPARLEELRLLEAGWLEGAGEAPPKAGLDWLADAFGRFFPERKLTLPRLYPTPDGGIQAEWSLGSEEVTLEIDLHTHEGRWHALDLRTRREDQRELSLDSTEDWAWLTDEIRRLSRDAA